MITKPLMPPMIPTILSRHDASQKVVYNNVRGGDCSGLSIIPACCSSIVPIIGACCMGITGNSDFIPASVLLPLSGDDAGEYSIFT